MFTKAITKKPCKALINGISTAQFGEGTPDYEKAVKQHDKYVETLRSLGLEVTDLEADERFPDSCFVEDPAVADDGRNAGFRRHGSDTAVIRNYGKGSDCGTVYGNRDEVFTDDERCI